MSESSNPAQSSEASTTEAYECDYEKNCTPLYKAIEIAEDDSEYEAILDYLETGEWGGPFEGGTGAGPVEQVKTWVTRFDNDDPKKVKWSQLPLHLAIVCRAPSQIVASLVKLYPQALRCTDDQHMLPLHLALRHEADDEVVAFLLIQFPEAVCAKGKNGRTAIECALRAKDKLRGIILEIFTEKLSAKISSELLKEKQELKNELENRTTELLSTENALNEGKKDLEITIEKFNELENVCQSLQGKESEFAISNVILEKARAQTEAQYKEMLKKSEADFNEKLEKFEKEKTEMQEKVEKMQSEKLLQDVVMQKRVDQLLATIKAASAAEKKARAEEASLRRELEEVQASVVASETKSDMTSLKKQVKELSTYRMERTRSETKSTMDALKDELNKAILISKTDENKISKSEMQSELKSLKKMLEKLQMSESKAKSSSELANLRNEVEKLREELKQRADAKQAKVELAVMKKAMEVELKNLEGKNKEDIIALRRAVTAASSKDLEKKSAAELEVMKSEFEKLKTDLREKQLVSKTLGQVEDLKRTLEKEMKEANDTQRAELDATWKAADELSKMLSTTNSIDEIIVINEKVESIRDERKKRETVSQIKEEVATLKKSLESEMKNSEGKTQSELMQMKKAIKELSKGSEKKDMIELVKVKTELSGMKDQLKDIEQISKTQQELKDLKITLENEMKNNTGKTDEELKALKKALDAMNSEQLKSNQMKEILENEIKNASGKTEEELKKLKKAVDSIDLKRVESKNLNEVETIRKEMEIFKAFLKKKQIEKVDATEKEIKKVKEAVAAIDIEKVETNYRKDFDTLRKEMEKMKADIKHKEEEEALLKKEIESLKTVNVTNHKKKKGLKKFFSLNFSRLDSQRKHEQSIESVPKVETKTAEKKKEVEEVPTILPPSMSMSMRENDDTSSTQDDSSYDSSYIHASKSRLSIAPQDLTTSKSKEFEVTRSKSKEVKVEVESKHLNPKESEMKTQTNSGSETKAKPKSNDTEVKHSKSRDETATKVSKPIDTNDFNRKLPATAKKFSSRSDVSKHSAQGGTILKSKSDISSRYNNKSSKGLIGKSRSSSPLTLPASTAPDFDVEITSPPSVPAVASVEDDDSREPPDSPQNRTPKARSAMKKDKKFAFMVRRVKSMDPRMMGKASIINENEPYAMTPEIEPYTMTRKMSKPVVHDNGEIELQEGSYDDDDEMVIRPRVSFVTNME